jgi:hypothetical protein
MGVIGKSLPELIDFTSALENTCGGRTRYNRRWRRFGDTTNQLTSLAVRCYFINISSEKSKSVQGNGKQNDLNRSSSTNIVAAAPPVRGEAGEDGKEAAAAAEETGRGEDPDEDEGLRNRFPVPSLGISNGQNASTKLYLMETKFS